LVLVVACGQGGSTLSSTVATTSPVSSTVASTSTTVVTTTAPTATLPIVQCDASPFRLTELPDRALAEQPPAADVPFDRFTVIAGTAVSIRVDAVGDPVIALIRGALPPESWAGEIEVIEILDGVPAALGPLSDGVWAVAWALSEDEPCDWYSLILYPPTNADEARAAAEGLR
jgi:hypothetical protein